MRITIIKADRAVYVEGEALHLELDWDEVPFDIAQWLGDAGWTVTNKQETPLVSANSLTPFVEAWQAKKAELDLEASPKVPQRITPRQLILQLVADGKITSQEGVAWATGNALPASIEAALSQLAPAEEAAARITIAAMLECDRSNPLLMVLAQALDAQVTEEELDVFFTAAAAL